MTVTGKTQTACSTRQECCHFIEGDDLVFTEIHRPGIRQVADTETEQQKTLDLTPRELGVIAFEDFDPAVLPKAGAAGMEIKRM